MVGVVHQVELDLAFYLGAILLSLSLNFCKSDRLNSYGQNQEYPLNRGPKDIGLNLYINIFPNSKTNLACILTNNLLNRDVAIILLCQSERIIPSKV